MVAAILNDFFQVERLNLEARLLFAKLMYSSAIHYFIYQDIFVCEIKVHLIESFCLFCCLKFIGI